jgi:hypothetical protein
MSESWLERVIESILKSQAPRARGAASGPSRWAGCDAYVGSARELDQLRGGHTGLRAGPGGRRPSHRAAAPLTRPRRPRPPPTSRRVRRSPWTRRSGRRGPVLLARRRLATRASGAALPGPRSPSSHVVAYRRTDSALHGTVDTLLGAASYDTRWVLLAPAESSGVSRLCLP